MTAVQAAWLEHRCTLIEKDRQLAEAWQVCRRDWAGPQQHVQATISEIWAHQSALRVLAPLCHLCHDLLVLLLGQALQRQVARLRQLPLQQHLLLLPRLQVGALLLGKCQQRPLLLPRRVRGSLHSRVSIHWEP